MLSTHSKFNNKQMFQFLTDVYICKSVYVINNNEFSPCRRNNYIELAIKKYL